jgi:hypothetical protein
MKATTFKERVFSAFRDSGFSPRSGMVERESGFATVVIGVERGFGNQCFINVGFVLAALSSPDSVRRVQDAHLYFRLERLFPEYREQILTAGSLDEAGQEEALDGLLQSVRTEISASLGILQQTEGLARAHKTGQLKGGLVCAAARGLLDTLSVTDRPRNA